jgi:branched-chain amino acid transport system ATP-binding protein
MKQDTVLETRNLTIRFGGLTAVDDFNASIPKGSIVGLIGPNGAGKTTVFNMISGFYNPTEGQVLFNGQDITGMRPYEVCRAGIARTFQNIRLFGNGTVLQNVMVGCHVRQKTGWWQTVLCLPSSLREEKAVAKKARDLLGVVGLENMADEKANSLPYGAQRRLEIARALGTEPRFLLLDEPAAGMNPQETNELMDFIRSIRERFDLSILLIEHDMKVVMGVCENMWVLDYGETIAEGDPDSIRANPKVIEAYLGEECIEDA